jgi:hypothetical protein
MLIFDFFSKHRKIARISEDSMGSKEEEFSQVLNTFSPQVIQFWTFGLRSDTGFGRAWEAAGPKPHLQSG